MDKIELLRNRKKQLAEGGKVIRQQLNEIIDQDSFVELSSFSFSKNDFYGETPEGEGVVTGFATIDGYPFSIVAQNGAVLSGGMSKANCEKIVKCLNQAKKNNTPVIYLFSSQGVQLGEGVNVLEGLAQLFKVAKSLKGEVLQYLIVNGELYGQTTLLASICDFTFFLQDKSVVAINSPFVLSAKGNKNIDKNAVGGFAALNKAQLCSFAVSNLVDCKNKILALTNLLESGVSDCENLNDSFAAFNKKCTASDIINIFDKDATIEVGASFVPEVKTYLTRIGGYTVAAVVFDSESGVKLNCQNLKKISDFAKLSLHYTLPYVTFVNCIGIEDNLETNNSPVLGEIENYIGILNDIESAKISVVFGKAVGIGYTLFAAKSMGYDFTYAFANAKIALFDSVQGAEIEFSSSDVDKEKLAKRYNDDNSDPIHAAKGGYIDNIIEPAFVRQYLIASLQMSW